jgi:hypothetical protein
VDSWPRSRVTANSWPGAQVILPFDKVDIEKKGILNKNKQTNTNNDLYLIKFTTKKYFINEYGKKRRIIKKRKYKPDIIKKK